MQIQFERTFNEELLAGILRNPRLYPSLSHDGHPAREQFLPSMNEAVHYMLAINEAGDIMGVLMCHSIISPTTYEIHHAILPKYWRYTHEIGQAFLQWLFSETPCQTAVGFTPTSNQLALRYAEKHMTRTGVIPKAYLKNGNLYDIHIFAKHKAV